MAITYGVPDKAPVARQLTSVGTADLDMSAGTATISGHTYEELGAGDDGKKLAYVIRSTTTDKREASEGTYTHSTTTLARTTVNSSTAGSDAKVDFGAETVNVWLGMSAEQWAEIVTEVNGKVAPGDAAHDGFSDFVADEHIAHSSVTLTAGAGLTGGGTIAANRSFAVGAGTGITVNADDVALSSATQTSLGLADSAVQPGDGIDSAGNVAQDYRNLVMTSVSGSLTSASHAGNILITSGDVTVPNAAGDVGFTALIIAGGAHSVTFNSTTSPTMATGDMMSVVVQSTTVIKAVLTEAADLVSFT